MNAVCHRCGEPKVEALSACPDCGYTPDLDDRPTAWLFSRDHLNDAELAEAAARIRQGERPDPGRSLLSSARLALRQPDPSSADRLGVGAQIWLVIGNLLFTPLVGLAVWRGLSASRPAASRQALRLTMPSAAALFALWAGLLSR